MADLRLLSYIFISLLYVIAMVTIVMRIWVRGFSMKSFGWDDWAMSSLLVRVNMILSSEDGNSTTQISCIFSSDMKELETNSEELAFYQIFFSCQQALLYFFLKFGAGM